MDEISKAAQSVAVWVGPEDSHTREALHLMKRISQIPQATYEDTSYDAVEAVRAFTTSEWISLSSFFSSPYFQRVWIVQELVFAKEVLMLWGKHQVPWTDLIRTSSYLRSTSVWVLRKTHASSFLPTPDTPGQGLQSTMHHVLPIVILTHWQIRRRVSKSTDPSEPSEILMMGRGLQATIHETSSML
ncbi:uncharacterized protein BDR25DRAFT_130563 [Lindgomyces ingoldianus]|uniref:Uncharacterized protein n=1 Tax=Lindgomyces ingoldianus TaxID=673940 RepID=A0ACB6R2G4_9PLEO|nr:uncharacterized protein BDR25DRAFT_130563 [Lindgomyces ingoldianus]KAF2473280.1 hypothetical protein BDR25DRAFT_130563 [Lindgomyces ingoldianus]